MRYYRGEIIAEIKDDLSPVTRADREAEQLISLLLRGSFPADRIVGEEFGAVGENEERVWYIDPIDGTRSFIHGVPLFAVLIGFAEKDVATIGVAYFPATGELFEAELGEGAWLNGKRISTNHAGRIDQSLILCGSINSFVRTERLEGLLNLSKSAGSLRHWGDAFGHCMVAKGEASAMIDPIVRDWDCCAVSCIVREAGGWSGDFAGNGTFRSQELVSTNGLLRDQVLSHF